MLVLKLIDVSKRDPRSTEIDEKMIHFCLKVNFGSENKFSFILGKFMTKLNKKSESFPFKWTEAVKSKHDNTSFSYLWNATELDMIKFDISFSQRCNGIFQRKWHEG